MGGTLTTQSKPDLPVTSAPRAKIYDSAMCLSPRKAQSNSDLSNPHSVSIEIVD